MVTAGQRGDSPQFEAVLEKVRVPRVGVGRPRIRPDRVRADKAYASRKNRAYLRRRGIRCTIPDKLDQARHRKQRGSRGGRPPTFDPVDYPSATRSSAESIASRGTAPWPRDTTSWRSATRRPSSSQPSTSGCDRSIGSTRRALRCGPWSVLTPGVHVAEEPVSPPLLWQGAGRTMSVFRPGDQALGLRGTLPCSSAHSPSTTWHHSPN
ncbi:transposase [Streptomyces venezuelae]|uniref:transposase n=1 Tax=Streptomyces venezuelae TaxID=54571 RepID=UPI00364D72D8